MAAAFSAAFMTPMMAGDLGGLDDAQLGEALRAVVHDILAPVAVRPRRVRSA